MPEKRQEAGLRGPIFLVPCGTQDRGRAAGREEARWGGAALQLHPWAPPCCPWEVRERTDAQASSRRSLKMQEDRLKGSLVEVAPERPPKRAGCCS